MQLGVDSEGAIQYLDVTYYSDCGCSFNDSAARSVDLTNLYAGDRFQVEGYSVLTDKASNTWCRAPGTVTSLYCREIPPVGGS